MRITAVLMGVLACVSVYAQPAQAWAEPWETWQPPIVVLRNPNGFDTYLKAFALTIGDGALTDIVLCA